MRVSCRGNGAVVSLHRGRVGFVGAASALLVGCALLSAVPPAAAAPRHQPSSAGSLRVSEQPTAAAAARFKFKAGDGFGSAVAISGSIAVIGAPGVRNLDGAAQIFVMSGGKWRLQQMLFGPRNGHDEFGNAVAVSGTTVAIAAWGTNGGRGAVYVYVRSGKRWHRQARMTASVPPPCSTCGYGDFGGSVALSGNVLVVSAYLVKDFSGATYIYSRSAGGKWHRQARLTYPGKGSPPVEFGGAVAASGRTVAIAALAASNSRGKVFLYTRSGGSWRRRATITGTRNGGLLGVSLSMSGTRVAAGEFSTTRNSARGYIFVRSGTRWRQQGFLTTPPARKSSDTAYNTAVAISGTRALIGDPQPNPHKCGAAYEYVLSDGRWREQAKLVNPGCASGDQFGTDLAISGNIGVIGAPGYQKGAGAAYVQALP